MADKTVTYEKGKLYQLDLILIHADPNQPRKYIDPQALEELAASIARHGVLEPVLFRVAEGLLYVVAGERRVEAAKKAGLTTIPAIFVEGNCTEIAIVENLLRQDLTAVEEAEALQALMTERNYTHEQLAGILGKARVTVTEILSLNRLPQEIRDECRSSSTIARRTLVEIARKKQERGMVTAWNQYKDKLARAAEGRKKREIVPESATGILNWVSKTVNKLDGLDTSAWTEEQKNTFNQTLMNLQESIQAILNPSEPDNAM
jgi:ParB family chromosome partitioning protein